MTWQPITTAPRDGATIDLWCVNAKTGKGYRVPDVRRSYSGGAWPDAWVGRDGKWVNGSWFYDDEGDRCFEPGKVLEKYDACIVATHWQPLPEPPLAPSKEKTTKSLTA